MSQNETTYTAPAAAAKGPGPARDRRDTGVVDGADAGAAGIEAPMADAGPDAGPDVGPDAGPGVPAARRGGSTTPWRFRDLLALDDFERHARRRLPRMIFQYVSGAVETGSALRGNLDSYKAYALVPQLMRDTAARSQAVTLFGRRYDAPFGVAPLGGAAFVAYRADLALAAAAAEMNVPMILSASSLIRLEDVQAANRDAWFQAYLAGDQTRIDRLVDRVARAGYGTFVVTADTPVLGNREHNTRSGFSMPIRVTPGVAVQSALHPRWLLGTVARTFLRHGAPHFENTEAERGPPMMSQNSLRNTTARDKLAWTHLEAIRRRWKGTLVVKGLLDPRDVAMARECGADGVILSNHGGRQLDHAVAPLDVLPEAVAAKGGMAVIVDSGIRRGTDVVKAMALGADFVLLGRPFLYAAVLGGRDGVLHAMRILREEINRDMALMGVSGLSELNPGMLRRRMAPG